MRSLALFTCLLAAVSSKAIADPLNGTSLPEGTRWVLHVNVDAARAAAPLWDLARTKFVEPQGPDLQQKIAILERVTGMKLPDQLHDVTLYGGDFNPTTACIRIHGVMDKTNMEAFLRLDPEFLQSDHAGHDILRWRDKTQDRLMYAGFDAHLPANPTNTWVILSPEMHAVEDALDAMDGKATLKSDSSLIPPTIATVDRIAPPSLLWIAARGLSELPRVQQIESPLLSQIDAASLSVEWASNRAVAKIRLDAKSDQTAQQLQAVAEGAKAFMALSAADEHASSQVRMLSGLLQQLTLQSDGKTVKAEWTVEVEKIQALMALALPAPAGAPPAGTVNNRP